MNREHAQQVLAHLSKQRVATIQLTREDLLDAIADTLSDTNDLGVGWHQFAEAVVELLEQHGAKFVELERVCRHCGSRLDAHDWCTARCEGSREP